jgi:hypothetical protein
VIGNKNGVIGNRNRVIGNESLGALAYLRWDEKLNILWSYF